MAKLSLNDLKRLSEIQNRLDTSGIKECRYRESDSGMKGREDRDIIINGKAYHGDLQYYEDPVYTARFLANSFDDIRFLLSLVEAMNK